MTQQTDKFEPWRKRLANEFAKRKDVQITTFSRGLGRDKDYVGRLIVRGDANPSPSLLIEICDALDVDPGYILTGSASRKKKTSTREDFIEELANVAETERLEILAEVFTALSARHKM